MSPSQSEPSPARRGRLPAAAREQRRHDVIDAALSEIVENGYGAVTMQAIARRAGASKETLYAWFGDRDGLVSAVIEHNADLSAERVQAALADAPGDLEQARRTLTSYAVGLLTLLTGEVSVALNRAAMGSPLLAQQLLASGRHRVGPIAEAYLERLHDAGILRVPDPAVSYRLLYGLVVQDTQIRVLLGEAPPAAPMVQRQAAAAVAAFVQLSRPE